ncbi:hypothetical protein [Cedecea sp. NFIX57]|uniref:hypothetical protein n=1 Tax=Cedecea sp. NFIX57 TaxID=1566286 RepID=UPI000A1CCA49|nr:hypothetical protein [Cedecea sp. NFIX57]
MADESIHVGVQSAGRIKWGTTYLSLRVNNELTMVFYLRADYSVNNHENQPEFREAVFRCSVRAKGERLAFELAGWDGTVIRHFWLDRQVKQGTFWPVVDEIQKYLHPGEQNIANQVANDMVLSAT